jgi:hypothetical protein
MTTATLLARENKDGRKHLPEQAPWWLQVARWRVAQWAQLLVEWLVLLSEAPRL